MRRVLFDELRRGDQDNDVSVMVVRGAGACVLARATTSHPDPNDPLPRPIATRDGFWSRTLVEGWFEMMDMSTPIIAQVHGYCLAGGSELAAACDLVYVDARRDDRLSAGPHDVVARLPVAAVVLGMAARDGGAAHRRLDDRRPKRSRPATPTARSRPTSSKTRCCAIAERVAQIPGDLLALNKRTVHRALEAMGMRTGVRATTELQALGLHQRSSQEYMPKLRSVGVKRAVEDRDAPFGDGRRASGDRASTRPVDASRPARRSTGPNRARGAGPHPEHQRRSRAPAPTYRPSAEATAELLAAHGLENVRLAGVEGSHRYVIGEWMHAGAGRADRPALRASRRAAAGHRRELGRAIRSNPTSAAAVSTGAGAADDKAGAVAHAHAVSARGSERRGALPCNVRVLIEGEEEIGSPTLHAFLTAHLDELRSDVLVLADAGNWKVGVPGLTYSLRGLAAADIELRALDGPLHSGMAGGAIPDPVMALARLLASLVDEHGDLAVRGRLGRRPTPPTRRNGRRSRASTTTRRASRSAMGVRPGVELVGDPRRHPARTALVPPVPHGHRDRRSSDQGSSNQIVARGVGAAQPAPRSGPGTRAVLAQLRAHVERACAVGSRAAGSARSRARPRGRPIRPAPRSTRRGARLRAGFGIEPVLMGVGGSIPFVGPFADAFGGIPALLMGPDDPRSRIHGENESLHLGDWRKLIRVRGASPRRARVGPRENRLSATLWRADRAPSVTCRGVAGVLFSGGSWLLLNGNLQNDDPVLAAGHAVHLALL